jgi:flagellar biosynthesis chaperone FliJ
MFSGFTIQSVDTQFRQSFFPPLHISSLSFHSNENSEYQKIDKRYFHREKYGTQIEESSGDENLVLAKIDDKVGWGVFAKKTFNKGDFIVRYGGQLVKKSTQTSLKQQKSGLIKSITNFQQMVMKN